MTEKLTLRITLDQHDHVRPLRDGRVASERVAFDFVDYQPLPKGFRAFVRPDSNLDVAELAVVTHLLAHHFGRPITGLAIPLWSRLPHTNLVCAVNSDVRGPADLNGRAVGVRAYAQTSGVWVRGVLASDYGVDLGSICWGTMEDAHLPEFRDPSNTRRYVPPPTLRELMMRGEFAAIMGERVVDPSSIRPVIPDPVAAAHDWMACSGITPINHILALRTELVAAHSWLPGELMRLFQEARDMAVAAGAEPPPAYGLAATRVSLQRCLDFSAEQAVTPRRYDVDAMFENV